MLKEKLFKKINLVLILIFILTITYAVINYMPYWDEAVYTNNGKFLFSAGEVSTYEYQRPPILSLLIGLFWFIGVNEVIFTKILLGLIFILGLFYLYKISEDIKKGSGVITTLLFASLSSIVVFTNRLLTEIPGAALSIMGYYFFTKKRYFLSGVILSLAFLFRYPSGLVFGILGVFLLIELIKERRFKNIKNIFNYGVGFSLLVIPFILINYFLLKKITLPFFQKIIIPFTHASQMVAANSYDLVTNGFIYYLKYLFSQNFLLVFVILAFLMGILFKKTRRLFLENKLLVPLTIALLYYIYISSLVHYEARYFFSALPFFVILGGFGIMEVIEKVNYKRLITIIEIILVMVLVFNFSMAINEQVNNNKHTKFQEIEEYYTYIQRTDNDFSGLIAVDNPLYGVYNEKSKIIYLSGPFYAYSVTTQNQPLKYIFYEERNLECWREEDIECFEKLGLFKDLLSEKYTLVYTDSFNNTKQYIYKLN